MDPKLSLLEAFYAGLPKDRVKLETSLHGFRFLDWLLTDGARLEYGQLTPSALLHKYKLTHVPPATWGRLLQLHLEQTANVCLYFAAGANELCCINLDNNHKTGNTVVIPEMTHAVATLRAVLGGLGCEPLVIASGRGFHLWLRLDAAVPNEILHDLLLRAAARALAALQGAGLEPARLKFNFYPDPRIQDVVSLRLFGSAHAKNRVFSRIATPAGLLDEAPSWSAFGSYLRDRTLTAGTVRAAQRALRA